MPNVFHPPKGPCFTDLKGKVALVTGGGSGIGRGISLRLAAEGMRLFICAKSMEPVHDAVREIEAAGGEATAVHCDVADSDDIVRLFEFIKTKTDRFDVLVHNAALMAGNRKIVDTDLEFWRQIYATNTESAFVLARESAKIMIPQESGSIVFISTIGAQQAHYNLVPYDSSKGALDSFTRGLAIELAAHNIRVNGVAPGAIPGLSAHKHGVEPFKRDVLAFADEIPLEDFQQKYIPAGRYGTPAEIAAAVAFLASTQASYITGVTLNVDGGATAQLSPKGIWI